MNMINCFSTLNAQMINPFRRRLRLALRLSDLPGLGLLRPLVYRALCEA
jgi:hypothetical protein